MAQNISVAFATTDVKFPVAQCGVSAVMLTFNATSISAPVTNGDRLKLVSVPANLKIMGAALRITGNSGITSICQVQTTEPTGNTIALSATTLAPSVALVALMTQPHSPITSVTATKDLEIAVNSGTLSNTTAGQQFVVDLTVAQYP